MGPELIQFVDTSPEGALLLSRTGLIRHANRRAASLFRIERRALIGRRFASVLNAPPEEVEEFLRLSARTREPLPGGFEITDPSDGIPIQIRCDGALLAPEGPGSEGVLVVYVREKSETTSHFTLLNQKIAALTREIWERKKAEQERDALLERERTARQAAESNDRMKDEFLATLSHELRTPLSAIVGWVTLLQEEALSPSVAEGVEVIGRNARVQTKLVEDLLDMSRIISGKIRLDVQWVDLAEVIQAAAESIQPAADAKLIRLSLLLGNHHTRIRGDPGRLQQIVWNLLSNSVKFTPKGGRIWVELLLFGSRVEISVKDTGEGISPEFLPRLFGRFRQGDSSTTRHHGGLGIGLSIAKQLVELHGGSIAAKSDGPGRGATFTVHLPVAVIQEPEPMTYDGLAEALPPGKNQCPVRLQGLAVMVVDDDHDSRHLLKKLLENCDARVRTASSAQEALLALSEEIPDVLVSDIGMPELDGYDLIRSIRLRKETEGGGVPAIALTAFARTEDRMRAMLAGYDMHLTKPVQPNELVVAVASLAGRTGRRSRQ